MFSSVNKNNLDDYDEKDMKIKFYSDDYLPLGKTLEMHESIIVIKSILVMVIVLSIFR